MLIEKARVAYNYNVSPGIYKIIFDAPKISKSAQPGQFVMIKCEGKQTFLRRPLSIAGTKSENLTINLVIKVVGIGTKWLAESTFGDTLDLLGPLGHGYTLTNLAGKKILLVAGGIGMASMIFLAEELSRHRKQDLKVNILFGAKTLELDDGNCFYASIKNLFPSSYREKITTTTEDGSYGHKGLVTDILPSIIEKKEINQIFACGPKAMLKKVAEISQAHNVPCQVCLEKRMACGVGACYSCVCRVKGHNIRVCKNGPVFEAKEVDWS